MLLWLKAGVSSATPQRASPPQQSNKSSRQPCRAPDAARCRDQLDYCWDERGISAAYARTLGHCCSLSLQAHAHAKFVAFTSAMSASHVRTIGYLTAY